MKFWTLAHGLFGTQMRRWLSSLVPLESCISIASACAATCSVSTTRPTG